MINQELLLELTESYLKSLISEASNTVGAEFDAFAPFGELGIDSFYVLKIVKKLEADFGSLPKTLLFEHFCINALALYFMDKHQPVLAVKFAAALQQFDVAEAAAQERESSAVVSPVVALVEPDAVSTAAAVPAVAAVAPAPSGLLALDAPILMLEEDAFAHPELGALVQGIFDSYKNESSVSRGTRSIAPNIFIGRARRGYMNYSRSKNIFLVYGYTGPDDYFSVIANEIYQHCESLGLEFNLFHDHELEAIGQAAFTATPFGVMQRVVDLPTFTLEGGAMRRLRYQVSKFEKAGRCRTQEYMCGSSPDTDRQIACIIDQWCESRTMVNPLIHLVRAEIVAGSLNPQHRLFVTYVDDVLQNAILISRLSPEQNGYLMDLEFYPRTMPLGGLEYAIVKMIEILVAEGCTLFSMGGTYGCKLQPSANPDVAVDTILDDLRKQDIFNDEGNLQFKNKFRTENESIFLCRPVGAGNPDGVIDIIMMIADPAKMQTSDVENHTVLTAGNPPAVGSQPVARVLVSEPVSQPVVPPQHTAQPVSEPVLQAPVSQPVPPVSAAAPAVIDGSPRSALLAEAGFNPLNIPDGQVERDLKTDSWAQLAMPVIDRHMRHLHGQLQQPVNVDETLRSIFPFPYVALTGSGQSAEHFFYKAWERKGVVLQNLLFPTGIFHQIDKDFTPRELPGAAVFQLDAAEIYKGDLDWEALEQQVQQHPEAIALVCIEVDNNAAGGYPVSMAHLKKVKALLATRGIPLMIDGTRMVENARAIIDHDPDYAGKPLWEVVHEICACADAVVASLTKDFCVNKGGLIATRDAELFNRIQQLLQDEGSGLDVIDKKVIALALGNKKQIETQTLQRMQSVQRVWQALKQQGVPVVQPAGAHCILVDVKRLPAFNNFAYPVASFVAWLYLNTGIRAGAHNAGMQKKTAINDLVRLAIPLGLKRDEIDRIITDVTGLFARMENIPELVMDARSSELFGDVYAKFTLKHLHRPASTGVQTTVAAVVAPVSASPVVPAPVAQVAVPQLPANPTPVHAVAAPVPVAAEVPEVAIVGLAGRYPKAKNMEEMWANLMQGRDCIHEIPDARFDQRRQHASNEKYRGGFIDDVDKFDSLFFNISPREAETLDPQERLFLEVAWEVLEDAGYYPEILAQDTAPRNIGVFVGAVWSMYHSVGAEERLMGNSVITSSFLWSIANRVSYFMNLSGPSMAVDTACSASLTALSLAVDAIQKGECSSAIVGGVNLDIHPCKQDITMAGGLLSEDGVCRTFGKGANGYVPGEGVGAVLLKPLPQAIQDGDNIYGVIKSIAVNHGGKTSGYSVPNSKAQGELVSAALKKANIDARSIGYIEAHGTGTELGDPIEITGLTTAFQEYGVGNQTCAIGSVKTNIGHLEAASGLVGVTKVLLQMRHRTLVPSLHSAQLNEFIDFKGSPFYVGQRVETWKPKAVDGVQFPLRAGVSSFGAGGSNAHVIVDHYERPVAPSVTSSTAQPGNKIFPLSARTEEQLRDAALRLQAFVQKDLDGTAPAADLNDIAYTLQVGRKSFDYRLAILADSKAALADLLGQFIDGKKHDAILTGNTKNAEGITRLLNRKEKQEFIDLLSRRRDVDKLAQLWTEGLMTDWQGFNAPGTGRRISLPTYPFADKRHWACEKPATQGISAGTLTGMHPMLDTNESTFERQLFKKTFNDTEFFIYDHLVSDIPTLPGVAYLDLVRKAGEAAAGRKVQKIRNILWVSPLTVENSVPTEVFVELKPAGDVVQFEVFRERADGTKQLYSQGKLSYATAQDMDAQAEYIDLEGIRARCEKVIDGKDAYPLFKSLGLHLGPSFQVLQEVHKNATEVLGALKIPAIRDSRFEDFILHPSLVDGSFQALMGAQLGDKSGSGEMVVPYSLGEVEILHPLTPTCFSYVVDADTKKAGSGLSKKNVFIVDDSGKILVKVRDSVGVSLTSVHEKPQDKPAHADSKHSGEDEFATLYYSTVWNPSPVSRAVPAALDALLLFDLDDTLFSLYQARLQKAGKDTSQVILVKPGSAYEYLGNQVYTINPQRREDFTSLFESLQQQQWPIGNISFAWPAVAAAPDKPASETLTAALENGIYPFLFLCQVIIERKLDSKVRLVYTYLAHPHAAQPHNDAVNGFAKILQAESSRLRCTILEIQQPVLEIQQPPENQQSGTAPLAFTDDALDTLLCEYRPEVQPALTVRYEGHDRYVRDIKAFDLEETRQSPAADSLGLKEQGVYLITGGAGGLGLIFARYLARECKARLVLTGRSALSAAQETTIEELKALGADVLYLPADVSSQADVGRVVAQTKARFGGINGIIHSAGVLRDAYVRNKTLAEMSAVFAPKVYGTVYLDEATQDEPLDFFLLFSSLAALAGNAGQSDYSFANHFMDSFARERSQRQQRGERFGKTLSLNWSLWADGGMQLDEQTLLFFRKNLGINPLSSDTGLDTFIKGLGSHQSSFAVIEGVQDKIERAWGLRKDEAKPAIVAAGQPAQTAQIAQGVPQAVAAVSAPSVGDAAQDGGDDLAVLVQQKLSAIVMDFLKLTPDEVDLDTILLDLGYDSIGLTTFANAVNDTYGLDVTPVLFFEYPNIREIAQFIATEHSAEVVAVHKPAGRSQAAAPATTAATSSAAVEQQPALAISKGWNPAAAQAPAAQTLQTGGSFSPERRFVERPIAVVGMSGVMPQSDDLDEFWENLKNAEDTMVTLIPKDRWSWEDYYGDPLTEENKTKSKWGGFMREVDKFDPLFWGISPREAEMMDPQQRIFLETVWKAVEDSGQKVSDLAGTKTGLFVGAATRDYIDLMGALDIELDGYSASGTSHAILANRVSFLLGLHGPSAPLDTACSSSLVALHRAIESIHTGSSDMAIVGGIQVMLTPAAFISFGAAGMLAADGKCKTFDKKADGYVRGEGSGAIFLKPLDMAEADGNHIYAIVKATAENHGGRATMLTAPNPVAQAALLVEAYEKAEIDPTTVGYIECHGTGTSLGDPIEIQAMKKAFAELYKRHNKTPPAKPHIGLTSAKSNIGHLETAAGIAGILKVLLSLKHKQIPALLHFEEINPYISLEGSPLYIVDKTIPWPAVQGADGRTLPRVAGVSSFGFGGANVHIVLEEYIPVAARSSTQHQGPYAIILSAKNEDRLKAYAQSMLAHIDKEEFDLADFAYTLQVGRNTMTQRMGFVVDSIDQLKEKLYAYINDDSAEDIYRARVSRSKDGTEPDNTTINEWFASQSFSQLLNAWVKGAELDWSKLYSAFKPKRISLPTYPFARERYWFSKSDDGQAAKSGATTAVIHPLVHRNTSIMSQQRYCTVFSGKESYLSEHEGQKVLPPLAFLEMGRAAIANALPAESQSSVLELHHVNWLEPVVIAENKEITLALFEHDPSGRNAQAEIKFEVYSAGEDASQDIIHCQGAAHFSHAATVAKLDIDLIKEHMANGEIAPQHLYDAFAKMGRNYEQNQQGIKAVYRGDEQQILRLSLPEAVSDSSQEYFLHPNLLEVVLQAANSLLIDMDDFSTGLSLPFALDSLKILSPCSQEMYAWVRYSRGNKTGSKTCKLDIDLTDSQGKVCVTFKSLAFDNTHRNDNKNQRSDFEVLLDAINNPGSLAVQKIEPEDFTSAFETILDTIY